MSFQSKKRLTLAEVLENLDFFTEDDEKDPMKSETIIFVKPPQVINDLSEEDSGSADEHCTEFDLKNFARKLLCAYRQGATLQVNRK